MTAITGFYRFLSIDVWGGLPAPLQRLISRAYTSIYNAPWSKWIIEPYCNHHYDDPGYLSHFKPASGEETYKSFQDFFSRRFAEPLQIETQMVWPAEGLLCEYGRVGDLDLVSVKGEERHLRTIFGNTDQTITDDYYFSNIFLHNNNYHRIHAPVSGTVKRIERISGDLVLLRPWVYKKDPSLPAFRNERLNIDLEDDQGNIWYLSIVGGPAVGTIELTTGLEVESEVIIGEEISLFLLGSTCCIASPIPVSSSVVGDQVIVGQPF